MFAICDCAQCKLSPHPRAQRELREDERTTLEGFQCIHIATRCKTEPLIGEFGVHLNKNSESKDKTECVSFALVVTVPDQ